MEIKTRAVSDIQLAIDWARLSYASEGDNGGEKDISLATKLSKCKLGTGHDSFLKSIVVHVEFTATHDFILQLYRYHFRDTASSTSKMHSITKGSIDSNCSKWVSGRTIELVDAMIGIYNDIPNGATGFFTDRVMDAWLVGEIPQTKAELFECIIHNTPLGYELTFGEITNYLQLKSMYKQRKSHKMSGWSEVFVEWVKSLPMSYLITGEDNE